MVFADHKVSLLQQLVAERQGLDAYLDKPLIMGLRPLQPGGRGLCVR